MDYPTLRNTKSGDSDNLILFDITDMHAQEKHHTLFGQSGISTACACVYKIDPLIYYVSHYKDCFVHSG